MKEYGIPNYERKSFPVSMTSPKVTDEMWDAIFGEKKEPDIGTAQYASRECRCAPSCPDCGEPYQEPTDWPSHTIVPPPRWVPMCCCRSSRCKTTTETS